MSVDPEKDTSSTEGIALRYINLEHLPVDGIEGAPRIIDVKSFDQLSRQDQDIVDIKLSDAIITILFEFDKINGTQTLPEALFPVQSYYRTEVLQWGIHDRHRGNWACYDISVSGKVLQLSILVDGAFREWRPPTIADGAAYWYHIGCGPGDAWVEIVSPRPRDETWMNYNWGEKAKLARHLLREKVWQVAETELYDDDDL